MISLCIKKAKFLALFVLFGFLTFGGFSYAAQLGSDFYWKDSYGRGVGTPVINSSYNRVGTPRQTGCNQADYPRHVGARCFKQEICSDRSGAGKSWGYDFDGIGICHRKKACTGCDVPSSYTAPSQPEYFGCGGKEDIGGLCYGQCQPGTKPGTALVDKTRCYNERNGLCPVDKQMDASLCYVPCRTGYKGNGPVCWGVAPNGYVECGAGFAKNDGYQCALVTTDQTFSGAALVNALSGNLVATKAASVTIAAKKLLKMPADAPITIIKNAAELNALGAKYGGEMQWMAVAMSKGPLDPADLVKVNKIFKSILEEIRRTEKLNTVFYYMSATIAPNLHSALSNPNYDPFNLNPDTVLEWVRGLSGMIALGIELSSGPIPSPLTYVAIFLDVVAAYAYPIL